MDWEPADHLQGSLGPSALETPKKSVSWRLRPREPPRVWKSLEKVLRVWKSLEKVPKRLFETFSRLLWGSGPEASGDFFQTFFGGFEPGGARETSVNLGGRFEYFFQFFSAREGGRGSPRRWEEGGDWFFIEIPGGGGPPEREGRRGREGVSAANWGIWGGGG